MKVLCSEGIANHTGPESCVVHREMQGEALTGESVGQPLSRERSKFRVPPGATARAPHHDRLSSCCIACSVASTAAGVNAFKNPSATACSIWTPPTLRQ